MILIWRKRANNSTIYRLIDDIIDWSYEFEDIDIYAEFKQLKDDHEIFQFEKVMESCLPKFDDGEGRKLGYFWIASPTGE